jgi:L-lactate utilization protein LutC
VNSSDKILGRVRRALGHETTPLRPEPPGSTLPSYDAEREARIETADLIRFFCLALEKAGGHPTFAGSVAELENCLGRLLASDPTSLVAVSEAVARVHAGCIETFKRKGTLILEPPELSEHACTPEHAPLPADAHLLEEYRQVLSTAGIGVTTADYAIADTGTLVLTTGGEHHRLVSLLPPVHICLLDSRRLYASLSHLLAHLHEEFYDAGSPPQATTFITGPSRTADIEQTLTIGVHGPHRLEVLLY